MMNPDLLPLLFGGSLGGWLAQAYMNRQQQPSSAARQVYPGGMGGPITDRDAAALRALQTPVSALTPGFASAMKGYPGYEQLNVNRENQGLVPVSPGYYANVYLPQGPRARGGIASSLGAVYQDSLFNPVRRRQLLGF